MAPHRRNIGTSRRQRKEEGEEEGSVTGGYEDDSLSEGSDISQQEEDDADGESNDGSEDNEQVNGRVPESEQQSKRRNDPSPRKQGRGSTITDTEAMMNGLAITGDTSQVAEVHYDEMKEGQPGQQDRIPTEPKREAFADKKRRDHERYAKERDKNPAFVPTRGSFFIHDKRSTEPGSNGHKLSNKSKSRPHGLIVDGNVQRYPKSDASERPWTHDLHNAVAGDSRPFHSKPFVAMPNATSHASNPVPTAPRSSPPTRSFSSTVLIGNVPAVVFLPGMGHPNPARAVPKKQHTRLPQHRPPLRRDKPVRISVPGQAPRYIFPSTERSFIFIPRALRPNQAAFRGRGRGGFFTSRRSSVYANSAYSPSVALSRRSSLGRTTSQEGYHSPAASVLSKSTMIATESGKPVVRLPPKPPGGCPPVGALPSTIPPSLPPPQPQHPAYRESRPAPIPMYQPRPQKTVSVADIETPAAYTFNPPQPQQEQPFHHQVPMTVSSAAYPPDVAGHPPPPSTHTPMSQIPEHAIHAQPFQPYDYSHPPAFYPPPYAPGNVYYPVSGSEYPPYNAPMGPGAPFPPPGQQIPYMMPAPLASTAEPPSQGTVAHEAGGTVYYYDAPQMYANPYTAPVPPGPGGVVGMGGMMTPPGTTYYYPQPPGVYYGPQ